MRALFATLLAVAWLQAAPPALADEPAGPGAFGFGFTSVEGGPLPLRRYAGRPMLVANTASLCGFAYQYAGLQRLWEAYRERGLVVLAVPSGDFGGQELGTSGEIKTFCETNFDLDFPMTEKARVRGDGAHPLFVWLRRELGEAAVPRWNFHKILVAPDGRPVAAWPSGVEPDSPDVRAAVERLLPPAS